MTEKKLAKLEFLANKVLEGHHVRTGYDLAPIILELIQEVRWLNSQVEMYEECHRDSREENLLANRPEHVTYTAIIKANKQANEELFDKKK